MSWTAGGRLVPPVGRGLLSHRRPQLPALGFRLHCHRQNAIVAYLTPDFFSFQEISTGMFAGLAGHLEISRDALVAGGAVGSLSGAPYSMYGQPTFVRM